MKLGYSITTSISDDLTATQAADRVIDRAEVATDAGFDYVQVGDHHARGTSSYLQSVPMTARMADAVDRVAPMFLLPVWDPVIVAEQVGTIAALADVDVWYSVGRAEQAEVMGVAPEERAPRMEEAISLIDELWETDHVTMDGEFYPVEDISINPKADPRVVIGGTAEPAVRRAGRLGDAWVANADVPNEAVTERAGWVEESGGGEILVRRDALVLEDGDRARELANELLADGYRGWDEDSDWVLAGDAADVAAQLESLAAAGADEVVVRPMTDEHAEETLRRIAHSRDLL